MILLKVALSQANNYNGVAAIKATSAGHTLT